MTNTRTIIHLDLDAFFCAVEEQRDETLRGKAFAVGGRPESRGVVSSTSYAARRFGVRSAMPMAHAVRLCPELIVVPPNFAAYRAASQQVMARGKAESKKLRAERSNDAAVGCRDAASYNCFRKRNLGHC
jgi:DNA polymerase-4